MGWGKGGGATASASEVSAGTAVDPKKRRVRIYAGGEPVEILMQARGASIWHEIQQHLHQGHITAHVLADGRNAVVNWRQVVVLTVDGVRGEEPPERLA